MKLYHQVIFNVVKNGNKQCVFRAITLSFPIYISRFLGIYSKIYIFVPADNVKGVEVRQVPFVNK